MSKNSIYRNIFIKSFLILLGIVVSLLLVEFLLRIFSHPETTLKFYDNPVFGSALVPNQEGLFVSETKEYSSKVKVNSQGWPDIEHNLAKPEDIYRMLILGDSFVENFQVPLEKRFFRQLQDKLGNKFEIIAMGRGNTGTGSQYLTLKNYGLKYKPDLVIHMFYEANDVKNNSSSMQNDPFLPYFKIDAFDNLVELPHSQRSLRKLAALKEFLTNFRVIKLILKVRQNMMENREKLKSGYPIDYHIYDKDYSEEYTKSWEVTKRLILRTKMEVENSGSRYIFIAIPGSEQIRKNVQETIIKSYPKFSLDNIDFEKPDQILKAFCEKEKIECYFMLSSFKEYMNSKPQSQLYYFYDGHWNETGTNLAALFLYQIISQN